MARGGGNISSWGQEIFPPLGDSVIGETLFRDTGGGREMVIKRNAF